MKMYFALIVFGMVFMHSLNLTTARGGPSQSTGRIVGGIETPINNFPFQVSVNRKGVHACGGSIIHERLILTAAHCITETRVNMYHIRAGSAQHLHGGVVRQVMHIFKHEAFNQPTALNNDIAILVLTEPLPFNTHNIMPISLASAVDISLPGTSFLVSGWGTTSSSIKQISPNLRYTIVQKIDQNICESSYRMFTTITQTMMCAGTQTGGRDSCQGDSGGPLSIEKNGEIKLAGIVSFGIGCANPIYPGVYTKVSSYTDWIRQKVANLSLN